MLQMQYILKDSPLKKGFFHFPYILLLLRKKGIPWVKLTNQPTFFWIGNADIRLGIFIFFNQTIHIIKRYVNFTLRQRPKARL